MTLLHVMNAGIGVSISYSLPMLSHTAKWLQGGRDDFP